MMMKDSAELPLVSYVLLAYNQVDYIEEAVQSAFAQTYPCMQVILSDDRSTDGTGELMQQLAAEYSGPHKVLFRSSPSNCGLASHVNAVLSLSAGEIVVFAAGDDLSYADRVGVTVDLFRKLPAASSVLLSADLIDEKSNIVGENLLAASGRYCVQTFNELVNGRARTFGATRAIRKSAFAAFAPLMSECPTEDTPFLVRSLLCGSSILSGEKGVRYRVHRENLGSVSSQATMNVDAIYAQHLVDFSAAVGQGLMDRKNAHKFYRWLNADRSLRAFRISMTAPGALNPRDVFTVMGSGAISWRRKLALLWSMVRFPLIGRTHS